MISQSVLVTDTNIWIDLDNGGVLSNVFILPYHFWVPDLAIPELIRPNWQTLQALGVMARELDSRVNSRIVFSAINLWPFISYRLSSIPHCKRIWGYIIDRG